MARNYTSTSTINLQVNAKQASQMLDKIKKDTDNLSQQFEKAKAAGDKVAMKNLLKSIKENEKLMRMFQTETAQAADVLSRLDKASPKELQRTLKQLKKDLNDIPRGSEAWDEQIDKIRQVKEEIAAINEEMRESQDESLWDSFKGFIGKYATGIASFIEIISKVTAKLEEFVKDYTEMQQEMANVQKFTGMSDEDVNRLNDSFKNLDTRTSREDLNLLAQEAGRLGKNSVEDVLGFVRAADKINVALDDLGEGATLTLSKLTRIFGDEGRLGTEKALLSVGSVINELSQNCSASSSYIADFASRMGGVGAQAGMTVQQIMAFGSVLDSQGSALEVSATALSQLIVKLYQDPAKYVKVAGLDVQEFTDLLKKDANEALLQFLETLHKAGKMDVLSVMFKDMGEKGTGMVNTLTTLAGSIEMVKDQQLAANEAFEEAVSIDNEFAVQNNTVMAGYEKSKKALKEITIELGEKLSPVLSLVYSSTTVLMNTMMEVIKFVTKNRTEVIILTTAIAAYHVAINLAAIKTFALAKAQAAWNAVTAVTKGIVPVLKLLFAGLANGVQYFTNGLQVNYAMQQRWQTAMKGMSFANWTGLILAAASALVIFAKRSYDAYKEQVRLREERKKFAKEAEDISAKSVEYYSKELSALKRLYSAAMDEAKSKKERIEAAKRLQEIYPTQFANMSTEAIMLGKAKTAYDNLTQSIINNAKAKAAAEKVLENEKKILDLEMELDEEREKRKKASAERDKIRAYNKTVNDKAASSAESFTGAIAMQAGGTEKMYEQKSTKAADAKVYEASKNIREKNEQKRILTEANNKLTNRYKNDPTFKSSLSNADNEATSSETPSYTGYTHVESEKERKKRLKQEAADRRKAEAEARREAVKAQKEFKDALKQVKGNRDLAEAEAKADRIAGLIDYREYLEEMRTAEKNFYKESEELYINHNLQEDADYKALLEKKADAEAKYLEKKFALDKEAIEREAKVDEQDLRAKYAEIVNPTLADNMRLQDELFINNYTKLVKIQDLYETGSKEWENYQEQIDDLLATDKLEKQKAIVAKAAEFQKEFDKLTVAEKYKLERDALEMLYKHHYIKEEEYRRWLDALNKKEKKERKEEKDALPGKPNGGAFESAEEAKAKFEAQKAQLDDALSKGIIDQEEYSKRLTNIKNEYHEALVSPLKEAKSEWVSLLATMVDSWMDFADALKGGNNPFDAIQKGLEASVAVMSAVMSQVTEFTKAEMQIQTAAIEKRYDREIAFAEGNSYMTKKLEKKKQEEIAQIKEDAANKEFSMQVIMAIAQTATNALNAYGSAAAIPVVGHVLAPIAAATAVAAGLVQVAAIKKQKEAAAATGYSKGGFTRPGDVDEPAGVVHAGEWVASQKLVKSPVARPIIDMLEYAQRTNRIGSLSMEDVSRSISAPMMLAYSKPEPEIIQVAAPSPDPGSRAEFGLSQGDLASSIDRLNRRLDTPIVAVSTVAGEFGSKQAQERYDRMIRNKSRRKRS